MTRKTELKLAYIMAAALFAVAVCCYTVFSAQAPDTPVRVMYKTSAGKVLFDHKVHLEDAGYGISCQDCHHHPEDEEEDYRSCGACHGTEETMATLEVTCLECHESDEYDLEDMTMRKDAFHGQCIQCHVEYEKGPEECGSCHVL
jgi:Zn finger protein HypA/HybF involved in hydrogenase expression